MVCGIRESRVAVIKMADLRDCRGDWSWERLRQVAGVRGMVESIREGDGGSWDRARVFCRVCGERSHLWMGRG